MKKILFTLVVLLLATPAWAVVNITAAQVGESNEVIISWETVSEPNIVRAFGLNITLSNDANVLEVTGLSADYWVYPGRIQINANGDVTYVGSMDAEYDDLPSDTLLGLDSNGVTLEAASLYAPVGPGSANAPPPSGDLVSIKVSADTTLCITANVSRAGADGVVMEDPDQAVTVNVGCIVVDINDAPPLCYEHMPDSAEWDAVGQPPCWCVPRQCHGDTDDLMGGSAKTGFYAVGPADLGILINSWLVLEPGFGPGIASIPNGICADFAHDQGGSAKTGFYRVGPSDLGILITNWLVLEPGFGPGVPPDCLVP
ncbi:MAG: hypothetical protein ACYSUY_08095 [Planctomycetota bacterium]